MTKQRETQERNAAEKKKTSVSSSLDGAWRQKEVRSFHLAQNGSDKIFYQLLHSFHSFQTRDQEKYERAVMRINQLKEERKELTARVDAQSGEIST